MEFKTQHSNTDALYEKTLNIAEFDKNFESAYSLAKSFENRARKEGKKEDLAQSYCLYGTLFRLNGNFSLAKKYILAGQKIISDRYPKEKAYLYYAMYRNYIDQSDFKNGLAELYKALNIYDKEKNLYGISRIKTEIGGLFSYMGDQKMCRKYLSEAKIIAESLQNKELIFLNNLYETAQLLSEKRYTDALNFVNSSLSEIKKIKNKKILSYSFENISTIHYQLKNYNQALSYLDSAITISENTSETALYKTNKALILSETGRKNDAEKLLIEFLKDNENSKRLDYVISARKLLIDLYKQQGNKEKAAEEIIKNNSIIEQFNIHKKNNQLREQEYEYELKLRESELKKENKLLKIAGIISVIILFFVLIIIINYRNKQKKNQQETISELNHLISEKEFLKNKESVLLKDKNDAERELVANTLYLNENKEILKELAAELQDLKKDKSLNTEPITKIEKKIKTIFKNESDWEKMILHFEKVNPDFFKKLRAINPKLTPNDLKHCAYIQLELNNKETAQILGVEPNSVKITRYRIKKKLNLSADDDLYEFLAKI